MKWLPGPVHEGLEYSVAFFGHPGRIPPILLLKPLETPLERVEERKSRPFETIEEENSTYITIPDCRTDVAQTPKGKRGRKKRSTYTDKDTHGNDKNY